MIIFFEVQKDLFYFQTKCQPSKEASPANGQVEKESEEREESPQNNGEVAKVLNKRERKEERQKLKAKKEKKHKATHDSQAGVRINFS